MSNICILEAKSAWPDLVELSESMHQLFGHSYQVNEQPKIQDYYISHSLADRAE